MLQRCYDPSTYKRYPTYLGCSVDSDWLVFSKFRDWALTQDYQNKQLDKDLLFPNNKIYSKDTCVFISSELNMFIAAPRVSKSGLPTGVTKDRTKFQARCNNPFTKTRVSLGSFQTKEQAHEAWKKYKHSLSLEYAKLESDPRIIKALSTRYLL